ncbi:hypothetical protein [Vallitalea guaymasensis]|uniref:Uncharacterized protein n=1 Tax=Vallitalea guaymasensis TaxID=1185412 RepID=A0A8J8MCM7_9FIRM|nr:hypothetical protein [Vallitalea guaymasensis]QUH30512.1 hypothetical protein HYG85_16995 [Vallitalea guaymasensis]
MKKSNKAKFKELTRKEKVEYIWEYYKLHIFAGIFVLIVIGSFLNIWVFNPPPKSAVSVNFVGSSIFADNTEPLEKELNPIIVTEEMGNKKVFINTYIFGMKDPQMQMATQTKFIANISARELDVLILDKEQFDSLVLQGSMLPLDQVFSEDELGKLTDRLLKGKSEEDTNEQIYGIDITDIEKIKTVMVGDSDIVIGVVSNTLKIEESKKVIKWFLEME